jgi:lysophospholipase L1-like esterase
MRTLLLLAVLIFHCDDLQNLYPPPDTVINGQLDWQKRFYFDRISEFKQNPIGKNKIVFLGNSIVKGGGNWNERYELNNIVNRGISGDYTKGVLKRLDEILFYKPVSVFLMIGINEFFADNSKNTKINPKYVAKNILKIADIISEHSPKTKVFIHTILPINNDQYIRVKEVNYNFLHSKYTPSINSQIEETNSILKSNRQYQVIDLHSIFIDKTFKLNPNLSSDGVHLNENGYNLWVQETMGLMKTLQNN